MATTTGKISSGAALLRRTHVPKRLRAEHRKEVRVTEVPGII